jgi:cilia- and flagella-associated protein 298
MVVIHVKGDDTNQFLYETTCAASNETVITELVAIWNMRMSIQFVVENIRELAKHGPCKPPDTQGLDEIQEKEEGVVIEKGPNYQADPAGKRTGNGPGAALQAVMERVCLDALASINKSQAEMKVALDMSVLQEKVDNMRGAVMMAFPMGLPEYDPIKGVLDGLEECVEGQYGQALLAPEEAHLWWAGKEFHREETVGDRVGRNEKTKIVGKLNSSDQPPGREPAVTEAERTAMMAHYFKKQEELKKLAEADDDDFHASAWANPKAMKNSLQGVGSIKPF